MLTGVSSVRLNGEHGRNIFNPIDPKTDLPIQSDRCFLFYFVLILDLRKAS